MSTETTPATTEDLHPQTISTASQRHEPLRRRLPDERNAIVHHFSVGGHEGYLMVGLYEDGQPGEIFIRMAKEGSTIAGLMDSLGIAVSLALQYHVPLSVLCQKFSHTRFEPSGWTGVKEIGYAKSIMDYIGRYLALKFLPHEASSPGGGEDLRILEAVPGPAASPGDNGANGDAPVCKSCGAIMSKNGSGYRCENCGSTTGDLP
jgi:ribonucleoside-diphosphate reductase alpha chain